MNESLKEARSAVSPATGAAFGDMGNAQFAQAAALVAIAWALIALVENQIKEDR